MDKDLEIVNQSQIKQHTYLVLELDEGDVVPAWDEADLLEAGELVEQHR